LKAMRPDLPVIMVTKSEEENLMNEAIGKRIDDYLVKPIKPSQIISAAKRVLDGRAIQGEIAVRDYVTEFNEISAMIPDAGWKEWIDIHARLSEWDLEISRLADQGIIQMHHDQRKACNAAFGRYVAINYPNWVTDRNSGPILSPDVFSRFVAPHLKEGRQVYYIVVDCLRLDHWLAIEPLISEFLNVRHEYYLGILPSATPFARNALFSGQFPKEMAEFYTELWEAGSDDEASLNRYEHEMMNGQLDRMGLRFSTPTKHSKLLSSEGAQNLLKRMGSFSGIPLVALVFNFIDQLAHGRSESDILREITPDEAAFRSLTRSWFEHSALMGILRQIARTDAVVVFTTDHGSVLGTRGTLARGNRDTSSSLRYKFGTNLYCDDKDAVFIRDPEVWGLPRATPSTNCIIAKEDTYFVYPTRFNEFDRQYRNSFQHGGISLEEMVLPVVTMRSKRG
ncbi:MAG: PglZ domain-containing protein, partial [Candidatus Latescibacteria bacterium]|nr:PglZ domain-containing protein [Candidatus Latescibacterota bacterium]